VPQAAILAAELLPRRRLGNLRAAQIGNPCYDRNAIAFDELRRATDDIRADDEICWVHVVHDAAGD